MDAKHGVAVDIASLARQLKEELVAADAPAARFASGCRVVIAEVGALTRNVSPEAYEPYHVSIGPYHRIKNQELARDDDKIRSLGTVLSVASAGVEDYLDLVARIEARARSCYAHTFGDMDSNAFVRMLLLDACYVLVNFVGVSVSASAGGQPGSGCGSDMMEAVGVVRDVIYLAENQIPFFVVDEIHKLTVPDGGGGGVSAADAVAGYIREILREQQYSVATPAVAGPPGPGNLLHLFVHAPDAHRRRTPLVVVVTHDRRQSRRQAASVQPVALGDGVLLCRRGVLEPSTRRQRRSQLDPRREAGRPRRH